MLSRNSLYFNGEGSSSSDGGGMPAIQSSHILVIGLGGVGSHAAHMLARSGVGYLRLVDFDQVTLSSLNRHACATLQDVGSPKATVLVKHLREICPDDRKLRLDPVVRMFTGDEGRDGGMLDPPIIIGNGDNGGKKKEWDMVIDAIDDVPTKAALIAHCAKRGIRVLSCMGAGGKADPKRIHISDLRTASRDPLATAVRQKLRLLAKKEAKNELEKEGDESNKKSADSRSSSSSNNPIKNETDGNADSKNIYYDWLSCIDDDTKLAVVYSSEKVVMKLVKYHS